MNYLKAFTKIYLISGFTILALNYAKDSFYLFVFSISVDLCVET